MYFIYKLFMGITVGRIRAASIWYGTRVAVRSIDSGFMLYSLTQLGTVTMIENKRINYQSSIILLSVRLPSPQPVGDFYLL